ncbi:SCO family protein, partial [Seonamhaeicola marinus]
MLNFFKGYKVFAIVFGVISVIIIALIYNTLNVYQPL